MRLADFISSNVEEILTKWDEFAQSIWPEEKATPADLRDDAEAMLVAVAGDMRSAQTDAQQIEKSQGKGARGEYSEKVDSASRMHALSRVAAGYELPALVAEYRALRASVIHLWNQNIEENSQQKIEDLTRFHESIDQLLAESIFRYTQRLDQSRRIFLGMLGHDLRNPLYAVKLLSDLLVTSGKLDPDSLKIASQIAAGATAMGKMIADLLDFTGTRLGGKIAISLDVMDLEPLCHEVLDEVRAIHPTRTFIFQREGDLTGQWDADRLRQLISNLLANAVQHGYSHTPIILSATGEEEEVNFSVRNQGETINPHSLPLIFEPLWRSTSGKSARQPGSLGLGLYIAREVAMAHRGSIDVTSAHGETVFTVMLPRNPPGENPVETLSAQYPQFCHD